MSTVDPAYHDQRGRWFRTGSVTEVAPHEAAAMFVWESKPIPPALKSVVRELLDGTITPRKPSERRQRAPRELAPHEAYAFDLHEQGYYTETEIAQEIERKYGRSCNQSQVSKYIKKARAWESGEIWTPYPRYDKRTVNRDPKSLERSMADRSGPNVDRDTGSVITCGGGTRVIRKSLPDPNGFDDD